MSPDSPQSTAEPEGTGFVARIRAGIDRQIVLICVAIAVATLVAYSRVPQLGFVNLDDSPYVYENPHLAEGFSLSNMKWVFLSFDPDNWFPLTRLSLLLDFKLFALRPAGYHVENVIIHVLAALLLFGFLNRATRNRWPSAFTAAVFALHPLHVESAAWVAERKDVLCAFFWFASLWMWVNWTERRGARRYLAAVILCALGAMAKPMIVTMPVLLFFLDVWPLRRPFGLKSAIEKLPFVAIAGATAALTVAAQRRAIMPMALYPPAWRLANASTTVFIYIRDMFWPARLWVLHSWPLSLSMAPALIAGAGLVGISSAVLLCRRQWPWLAVGWFWYLATLVPVIGLVQVGPQTRADRYMYVPMVGLLLMLSWSAAQWIGRRPGLKTAACAASGLALIAMACVTWQQTAYWADTDIMLKHSRDMQPGNYWAMELTANNLDGAPGASAESIYWYHEALRLNPNSAEIHNNLGCELANLKRYDEATAEHLAAIRAYPEYSYAYSNLGTDYQKMGRMDEAFRAFRTALRINPDLANAHNELGVLLWKTPGRSAEGLLHLEQAVRLNPEMAIARHNLGRVYMETGRLREAEVHLKEAIRLNPLYLAAHSDLGATLMQIPGRGEEALVHLRTAQEIEPNAGRAALIQWVVQGHSGMPQ